MERYEQDQETQQLGLTIKYVSHPGRNLSSSIRSSESRWEKSVETVGKLLSILIVDMAITRAKSVILPVLPVDELRLEVEDEASGP